MARARKNPYLFGTEGHGQASEKKVAKYHGATVVRGSGAGHNKSDSVLSTTKEYPIRFESKATIHESMSVKRSWLEKIQREALETNMYPALTISFVDEMGNTKHAGGWVAVPESLFKEIMGILQELEGAK